MATTYSKDFLLDAFCFRYDEVGLKTGAMRKQASDYYDKVTKAQFRTSCSLDSDELARYQKFCLENAINY